MCKKFFFTVPMVCMFGPMVLAGCASTTIAQEVGLSAAGGLAYAARSPSTEIEQIYYLGSFDPRGQLKPEMYRIRVHGQASALSSVKFGSGWAPAALVDSISTNFSFGAQSADNNVGSTGSGLGNPLAVGRAQMMFGPQGFREAPRNHRLVIVMGGSPQAFFDAVDDTLGAVAKVEELERDSGLGQELFKALTAMINEKRRLDTFKAAQQSGLDRITATKPKEPAPVVPATPPPDADSNQTEAEPETMTTVTAPAGSTISVTPAKKVTIEEGNQ